MRGARRGITSLLLDRPWVVILTAAAIAAAVWGLGTRSQPHHVRVKFAAALNLYAGNDVRVAGVNVGRVTNVQQHDGQAVVELGLDDTVWPLPRGSSAEIRLGSTSGNANRYVELTLGPRGAPSVHDGGVIAAATAAPVELDQILGTFDRPTRRNLAATLANAHSAMGDQASELNGGIHALPPALRATAGVMDDLAQSQQSLSELVYAGDAVTRTLDAHRNALGSLLQTAGATFDAVARNSEGLQRLLDAFPPALSQVQRMAVRMRPTFRTLTGLMSDLRPGAERLQAIAPVATTALTALRQTSASGVKLAETARPAVPQITRLLATATPFVARVAPALNQTTPIVSCLRPYTPEIEGFFSGWGSATQWFDNLGGIGRPALAGAPTAFMDTPGLNASKFVGAMQKAGLGFRYAQLRPPGWNGGKPEFLPQCGVGPDGVDPAKDWDAR